jgi:hypothetical protein
MMALMYAHSPVARSGSSGLSDYVVSNMECFALQQVGAEGRERGGGFVWVSASAQLPPRSLTS